MLIVSGVLLLFTKLNFIPAKYIDAIVSWQSVVILIGLISIVKRQFLFGLSLIFVGKFFLIPDIAKVPDNFLGAIPDNFVELYWPFYSFLLVYFYSSQFYGSIAKFETIREKFLSKRLHDKKRNGMRKWLYQIICVFESPKTLFLTNLKVDTSNSFGETKFDLRKQI